MNNNNQKYDRNMKVYIVLAGIMLTGLALVCTGLGMRIHRMEKELHPAVQQGNVEYDVRCPDGTYVRYHALERSRNEVHFCAGKGEGEDFIMDVE